ncbi:UvrD-helicase domain-containing protein [Frateuria aurantia]|uniref:ATP-dependent DNA helicase Rep n=1 Tax=Frateuria aurantia (strain ATCC 33424 / DSM 6220 / KCTC 2777 / LMG 1558 / NBRC 3245 / NCIMB 13370) TaxID=767434 RepID=H8L247_FRAAD|nr:UvrD-helicase domain-containing protein [Frateuria aurantia]AFC87555.1 DNA/RNA helicase, superfamily I [Frateuria aurantia DSM 6220]
MLNPQQLAAVEYCEGPLLVLAGAGSGKTSVITQKIAWLIGRRHVRPARIAAITFTNKAAREMRERIGKLISEEAAKQLTVSTFHAMGLKFLQMEHEAAGLRRGFSVLDADDSAGIVKELAPKGAKNDVLFGLRNLLSRYKNGGLNPDQALRSARTPQEMDAATIYQLYQNRLEAYNAVDFDDLIRLPLAVLEGNEEVRARWQEKMEYLLVDEYQDTNDAQYRLLKMLAGERGHFTCVGDDDQSIYAWRGANPENIDQLGRDWPQLRVIKLEQNYRCSRRVLRAANRLIANNPHLHEKKLWSDLAEGPPIRVLECKDSEHEAERLAGILTTLAEKHKAAWSDIVILYRGNFQARPLEKALRLARVPYHLTGALSFLDRVEVKDLLCYLRLLTNPSDDAAFIRVVNVPRREIGATTLEKLGQLAQAQHSSLLDASRSDTVLRQLSPRPAAALAGFAAMLDELRSASLHQSAAELVETVLSRTQYAEHLAANTPDVVTRDRKIGNLKELADWFRAMQRGRQSAGDLAGQLALLSHADRDEPGNAVRMMTLHAAKGLEFRFVFIVGCEDGTLPHEGAIDEGRTDEERRLMYVGITRAKEMLTLSWSARSSRYGEVIQHRASRFLDELPPEDLHWDGKDPEADAEIRKDTAQSHLAKIAALLGQ